MKIQLGTDMRKSLKHLLVAANTRITASWETEIRQFFSTHPNPSDPEVHDFARTLGTSPEELERHIYELFTRCNDEAMGSWCQTRGCMTRANTSRRNKD